MRDLVALAHAEGHGNVFGVVGAHTMHDEESSAPLGALRRLAIVAGPCFWAEQEAG